VRSVAGSADLAAARDVCGHHSFVVTPASYAGRSPGDPPTDPDVERSQFFVPAPEAAAAVRRFVSDALDAWGLAHLIADATLVVSELATNALVHASSPFRISIARLASAVRIAVHDASAVAPLRRSAPPDATGGRGMTLVAAVAQRWGTEAVAGDACGSGGGGGKVVWAELASA
jgi:anti-sigma regulatory factor (Ser/Thr protein kinase)